MLDKTPETRITAIDALNHPWFDLDSCQATFIVPENVIDSLLHYKAKNKL
jgi:hypothetical protein